MSNHLARRSFLRTCGGAGLAAALGPLAGRAPAARRPNLVLLHADDLGWTDLACFGSGYYETPHLDRLRTQGVQVTNAYSAAANCAPSRACMLTGQWVPRHGIYTVGGKERFDTERGRLKWSERRLLAPDNAAALPPEKVTFAEALAAAGYVCGLFGKWHLGGADSPSAPTAQGFHEAVVQNGGQHFGYRTRPPRQPAPGPTDYLSDHLADQALAFVERHRAEPFLLYLPDYLVHVPLQAKADLIAKYQAKPAAGGHRNPVYAAMIESLDHSFGRVLAKLDELNLTNDTLVVFFSDNGGVGGVGDEPGITSNKPLRGTKGQLYEGGIRVPMIVRWPGRIAAGSTCDAPVHGVDIFPTFLAAAGAPPPPDQVQDGENVLPLWQGQATGRQREDLCWWMPGYLPGRQAPAQALRAGDWKLLESFETGGLELFNLRDDLGETHNMATQEAARARAMHERMVAWRAAVGAEVPPRNPDFDPRNAGKW